MAKTVETAMTLMLMAAALLDKAGERAGAAKLREAIDAVRRGGMATDDPREHRTAFPPPRRGARIGRILGAFRRTRIT